MFKESCFKMIMEKGMSIGFSGVSGKASSPGSDVVGLGLKLQSSESFPANMMSHHHHQFSQPVIGNGGGGPTSNSRENQVVGGRCSCNMSHLYHFDHDVSGGFVARTLHPFHISNLSPFKSPERGVMAAATLGFPFTEAQWKELQRQAMIYKYMMSSVPVPPHLLLPIPRNFSSAQSHSACLRVSNGKDAEPGRCKRTDGKKWRCSRDVAPHQKYCERHMHRGRPRSRKPVEVHAPFNTTTTTTTPKKARLNRENPLPSTTPMAISSHLVLGSTLHLNENTLLVDKCPPEIPSGLDLMMEGEMGTLCESEQQWQQLMMHTNIGLTSEGSSIFREEPLNLIPYTDFGAPDLMPLEKDPQIETPVGFIDAWSNDKKIRNESSASSLGNLSPSSLSLSMAMAAGKAFTEETGQIQMGLGVADKDLLSPVPWMGCAPGGPLAEALQPSSKVVSNGDLISPPAKTVSSPSGVLQRTMLSQSDSSGCNSPTLAATTTAPPEIIGFKLLS